MKIAICASIEFTNEIKEIADRLEAQGHDIELPFYTKKILRGDLSLEEFKKVKEKEGDISFREKAEDLLKRYFNIIKDSDAILVLNLDKKNIRNYIGGNTLIEMAFAHVLNKKIFLWNMIPDMHYKDELLSMKPIVINKDLNILNQEHS